jgi:hypothetical protein
MVLENILGVMEDIMRDIGKIVKCMVKVHIYGLMEENLKENLKMIKKMVLE